jgi:16S rRNA (adenine1518-N6/adenine1519-N6)-dimethyltransferase
MVSPKKHLGQNFLTNKSICDRIASCVDYKGEFVIEIGGGMGALTDFILQKEPAFLLCIEKDVEAFAFLQEKYQNREDVKIVNLDATQIKFTNFLQEFGYEKCHIIGNLPYNVGTTIVINLMEEIGCIRSIVVMLQKEVIDRIIAKERTKDYGRVSVLLQSLCDVKKQFDVNKNNFFPIPKVESSVVKIVPKNVLLDKEFYKKIDFLCKTLFQNRRKVIFRQLLEFGLNDEFLLDDLKLTKNVRAEELSVEKFVKIAELICQNQQ